MKETELNQGVCHFIKASPTPFHAAANLAAALDQAGYQRLDEASSWRLTSGQGYYVTRNASSLIAFNLGEDDLFSSGFSMLGAHTDSPCLKLKPQSLVKRHGYAQLAVEVYGGVLLNPWFDRDLSIAGRVNYLLKDGRVDSCLLDFERAVATIPSLAIHLDREVNNNRSINAQNHLPPVFLQPGTDGTPDFGDLLLDLIREESKDGEAVKILDYELSLYDVQPPAIIGFNGDFLAGARLDNLLSCYVGLQSLLSSGKDRHSLLVCTDHEEVGSVSAAGAGGSFLEAVLERIVANLAPERFQESMRRMLNRSMLISVDNAHGIHPNYPDKHDQQHGPILNQGPVLKINANQRYASNSETAAWFRALCGEEDVPLQAFVVRSDMVCGSTIGPIIAAQLGVRTLDIGVPTFGMHSIRELAGSKDSLYLHKALARFLNKPRP